MSLKGLQKNTSVEFVVRMREVFQEDPPASAVLQALRAGNLMPASRVDYIEALDELFNLAKSYDIAIIAPQ